ncbi:MAG: transcriptional coactivator p15/PC4 family protein [Nanoarchaeota archaeon]|nr:transcriptional coactivator p15/PC4 family protein [Nanoarchaeota archaeon]
MDKDIGKINKGEFQGTTTDIVVGVREYNGRVGVDIREFTASEKYTGPTKKGLRIPVANFAEFKEMINSISEEDLKEGSAEAQGSGGDSKENEEKNSGDEPKAREDMPDY